MQSLLNKRIKLSDFSAQNTIFSTKYFFLCHHHINVAFKCFAAASTFYIRSRLHLLFGCAVWKCISLSNVFLMSFSVPKTNKMTSPKTHLTAKRTSKLHIQNAVVIDP
jgi:hypothetical protein